MAEKGKQQMSAGQNNKVKRIKAPSIDTSALIKDNALTLIGRLTNPHEQKMWALIPALPRKWNLQGRAVGSDLGNNRFQFRFEREEDIRRVLNNRPYHFAYWMVILQRWEPVISNSFPSMIPFWIRIKGLPLHYWQDDMVCRVGQELGTLENHELTKTTARVQVSVDGLKPLVKELIIEFDSGEETYVTLEYERLEYHCSHCFSLLHSRRNCPQKRDEEITWNQISKQASEENRYETTISSAHQLEKREQEKSNEKGETDHFVFKARVDRHGRPFGDRVSTRQTGAPPPAPTTNTMNPSKSSWGQKPLDEEPEQHSSPQYTHSRQINYREARRGRDLFSQRSQGQWRAKQPMEQGEKPTLEAEQQQQVPHNTRAPVTLQTNVNATQIPSMEDVMEDLHEATRLYLSCPDPAEAVARRQRVLQGDALGQTEEWAAAIIEAETRKHAMIPHFLRDESNPNTPPPNQNFHLNEGFSRDPSTPHSPLIRGGHNGEGENTGMNPHHSEVEITPSRSTEGPTKLKSIVVSPSLEPEQETRDQQEPVEQSQEEETLKEFQNKVRRRVRRPAKARMAGSSPNILRGTSSRKRNISQIQNSPARGAGPSKKANSATHKKANKDKSAGIGPSNLAKSRNTNPPINLIPARTKGSSDFRASRHPAP